MVLGLSLVLFFRMLSVFLVLPIFNILAQDLQFASIFLVGLAFGIYGLTQGLFQLPFGYLSDRLGRKNILLIALFIFLTGSILASYSDNIYWLIIARFIQGIGALASVVFALLADNTREQVRARASAFLGISVGVAFGIAFIVAPLLSIWITIQQLFLAISILSFISIIIVLLIVPNKKTPSKKLPFWKTVFDCLKIKQLRIIYIGSFVSGTGLSALLFITQIYLFNYLNYPKQDLWKVYTTMMSISVLVMFPITFYSEIKNRFDRGILIGIVFLLLSFGFSLLGVHQLNFWFLVTGLIFFFIGYSVFEPIFPSLVTRLSNPDNKGTASGLFNLCQFFGHFVGALISSYFLEKNINIVYYFLFVISFIFLYFLKNFQNPIARVKTKET